MKTEKNYSNSNEKKLDVKKKCYSTYRWCWRSHLVIWLLRSPILTTHRVEKTTLQLAGVLKAALETLGLSVFRFRGQRTTCRKLQIFFTPINLLF